MTETNKIEEIKEEQKIVEGYEQPKSEDKEESIYSHLTDKDLNADYKPQEEADVKEASGEDKAKETESVSEETSKEEESQEDSSRKWDINGTTYNEEDMGTRMVKDYENLTSFSGKQSEKIGGYKQKIAELEDKIQTGNTTDAKTTEKETDSAPLEKKDYDIYTQDGMVAMAKDVARQEFEKIKSKAKEENKQVQFERASNGQKPTRKLSIWSTRLRKLSHLWEM